MRDRSFCDDTTGPLVRCTPIIGQRVSLRSRRRAASFFFKVKLERPDLVRHLTLVGQPREASVMLGQEEVHGFSGLHPASRTRPDLESHAAGACASESLTVSSPSPGEGKPVTSQNCNMSRRFFGKAAGSQPGAGRARPPASDEISATGRGSPRPRLRPTGPPWSESSRLDDFDARSIDL